MKVEDGGRGALDDDDDDDDDDGIDSIRPMCRRVDGYAFKLPDSAASHSLIGSQCNFTGLLSTLDKKLNPTLGPVQPAPVSPRHTTPQGSRPRQRELLQTRISGKGSRRVAGGGRQAGRQAAVVPIAIAETVGQVDSRTSVAVCLRRRSDRCVASLPSLRERD